MKEVGLLTSVAISLACTINAASAQVPDGAVWLRCELRAEAVRNGITSSSDQRWYVVLADGYFAYYHQPNPNQPENLTNFDAANMCAREDFECSLAGSQFTLRYDDSALRESSDGREIRRREYGVNRFTGAFQGESTTREYMNRSLRERRETLTGQCSRIADPLPPALF